MLIILTSIFHRIKRIPAIRLSRAEPPSHIRFQLLTPHTSVTFFDNNMMADRTQKQVGLAAKVPKDFEQTIRTMGEDYNVVVEEDQVVSINDSPPS